MSPEEVVVIALVVVGALFVALVAAQLGLPGRARKRRMAHQRRAYARRS